MTGSRNNAASTRGKPFEPGNPGRRHGARHKITRAIEELLEGEHEALTRKAIEMALEGDMVALRLCLDRIAPARKDSPVSIPLPSVKTATEAVAASVVVLEAMASGEVTPEEAGRIIALLVSHKAILEAGELEARVAALETGAKKLTR